MTFLKSKFEEVQRSAFSAIPPKLVRRKEQKMYRTESGLVTDEQAKAIMLQNSAIWDKFWSIPHEKRTQSDWEELLKVQILVKE